jgi:phosphatidyl-myo-inositol alpha-mannosyltransferase
VGVDRFEVVPNGVEVARFARVPERDAAGHDGPETLLFVGRLEPRKGLATLIEAFVRLRSDRPGVRLVVVGEGPERARCEAALPGSLRRDVRFLGRVDDAALVDAYAEADLYVSPALGGESFGIVLLEAMAAGRAVVASDLPGYRSVVSPGRDGLLVPPGDAAALATALAGLLDDPDRRASMIAAGRATAAAHDWPVVARRLRAVYQRAQRA